MSHMSLKSKRPWSKYANAVQKIPLLQENAVLVSIHMNYFAETQYSGLQVWYSKNDSRSRILASLIQSEVKNTLQPNNKRTVKESTSSIFLLHNATFPAVLVECGFLSNPREEASLRSENYQKKICCIIASTVAQFLTK